MPGLIGQALMNVGSTIGGYMMQGIRDDEVRADRLEMQRERERERAELQRERLAATERENQRNRELRAELAPNRGGGSSGGLSGDALDEAAAGEAGMSVPEYKASRERFKTGDMSALKRDVQKVSLIDTGDPYAPDATSTTVNEVPKWLEQEERAKWKTIERLRVKYSMGEKYKGMTEGEQNDFETGVGQGIIAGTMNRDIAAGAVGAMKGTGAYKEGGGTVIDQYRGGPGVSTAVGESQRQENLAKAGQATAAGRLSDARANAVREGEDPEVVNAKTADLQRKINSARARLARELGVAENEVNAALLSLSKNKSADGQARLDKAKPFIDSLDAAQAAMDNWKPGKTKTPPPAPAAPASGGRKVGDTQVVQAGPNRGKTARWDGRGWVLVD